VVTRAVSGTKWREITSFHHHKGKGEEEEEAGGGGRRRRISID